MLIEMIDDSQDQHREGYQQIEQKDNIVMSTSSPKKYYQGAAWYKSLLNAEKTCMRGKSSRKFHYKFDDGREMVEEYNLDTQVLMRRIWKLKGKLDSEGQWEVELGPPIPDMTIKETMELKECADQPSITRRNTRINLEWRISNLPYDSDVFRLIPCNVDNCIIVRTTNNKYFKKLVVPELTRLGLAIEKDNISFSHRFHTLIILYKKPPELLEFEKDWYEQLKSVESLKDIPDDCSPH